MSLGERWLSGFAFGEIFLTFKRVSADDLAAVLEKFEARSRLVPTATTASAPEAEPPKRFTAIPEIALVRREPDGEGFIRLLEAAWERFGREHPRRWTANRLLPLAVEFQRATPGAFVRLLEGMRRFWAELPPSPYYALERERVRRFLDFLDVQLDLP